MLSCVWAGTLPANWGMEGDALTDGEGCMMLVRAELLCGAVKEP